MKINQKIVFQILSNTINGQPIGTPLPSIEDQDKAIRKQKAEIELIEDAIIEETK